MSSILSKKEWVLVSWGAFPMGNDILGARPYIAAHGTAADNDHNNYHLGYPGAVAVGLIQQLRHPQSGGAVSSRKFAIKPHTALQARVALCHGRKHKDYVRM